MIEVLLCRALILHVTIFVNISSKLDYAKNLIISCIAKKIKMILFPSSISNHQTTCMPSLRFFVSMVIFCWVQLFSQPLSPLLILDMPPSQPTIYSIKEMLTNGTTLKFYQDANFLRCTKILSQCHLFLYFLPNHFLPCKYAFMNDYDGI